MTRITKRLFPAAAAIALVTAIGAGAAQATVSTPLENQGDPGQMTWIDSAYPANLVVVCDIDGTSMEVGSFEVCDIAGGSAISAEV